MKDFFELLIGKSADWFIIEKELSVLQRSQERLCELLRSIQTFWKGFHVAITINLESVMQWNENTFRSFSLKLKLESITVLKLII